MITFKPDQKQIKELFDYTVQQAYKRGEYDTYETLIAAFKQNGYNTLATELKTLQQLTLNRPFSL